MHSVFDLTYCREVGQKYKNIFVEFLVQMKTTKSHSEINWPLHAPSRFSDLLTSLTWWFDKIFGWKLRAASDHLTIRPDCDIWGERGRNPYLAALYLPFFWKHSYDHSMKKKMSWRDDKSHTIIRWCLFKSVDFLFLIC